MKSQLEERRCSSGREILADTMPRRLNAVTGSRSMAVRTQGRRCRVGTNSPIVNFVSSTTTADVVDRRRVLHQALLLRELLVEAEDGALLLAMKVSRAATAAHEVGVGWRRRELADGGRACGIGAGGDGRGVDAGDVAGAATAGVVVVAGRDGGMRLGDLVGGHLGGLVREV